MATMNKKDVIYPGTSNTHAKLSVFDSVKGQLIQTIEARIEAKGGGKLTAQPKLDEAAKIVKDAKAKQDRFIYDLKKGENKSKLSDKERAELEAAYLKKPKEFDAYWKCGMVGNNLVVRVKVAKSGWKRIFGYDEKDAVVLKNVQIKQVAKKEKSDSFNFPTYVLLDSKDVGKQMALLVDFSSPYTVKMTVTVDGSGKSIGLAARIRDLQMEVCEEYRAKAASVAADLEKKLLSAKVGTMEKAVEDANKKLATELSEKKIQSDFEKRVKAMVSKEKEFAEHYKEWKFTIGVKATIGTLKMGRDIARLAASSGSDATAYFTIAKTGYDMYNLYSDFKKTEESAGKALAESIEAYRKSALPVIEQVESIYSEFKLSDKGTFKAMTEAGTKLGDAAKNRAERLTKNTIFEQAAVPQDKYKRYLVSLHQLAKKADAAYKDVEKKIDTFKNRAITDAVKVWPELTKLKKAAKEANDYLQDRKVWAASMADEIKLIGINLDDRTTLAKLRTLRDGLRSLDTDKIKSGAGGAATVASNMRTAWKAVDGLVEAVKEL